MNLGDRINCGKLTPSHIGLPDKRVQAILTDSIDAKAISVEGSPLAYSNLTNGSSCSQVLSVAAINSVLRLPSDEYIGEPYNEGIDHAIPQDGPQWSEGIGDLPRYHDFRSWHRPNGFEEDSGSLF